MTSRAVACLLGLTLLAQGRVVSEDLSLDEVLANAAAYVAAFEEQLSAIVAEETYEQRANNYIPRSSLNGPSRQALERRTLKSDILLLRPESPGGGPGGWVQFRDVFEVDGRPVRDRAERLTRLFLDTGDAAGDQLARIIQESARYNIGDVQRTINVPVLPLMMIERENQRRFRFKRADDPARPASRTRDLPDAPTFTVSTDVWVVSFEEVRKPTLIQLAGGGDIASSGRFWIEPTTGRVLMSELVTENPDLRAQINISYQSEPLLGLLVPVEMRERYSSRRRATLIEGTATYGRFRRFQVQTDEAVTPLEPVAPTR